MDTIRSVEPSSEKMDAVSEEKPAWLKPTAVAEKVQDITKAGVRSASTDGLGSCHS